MTCLDLPPEGIARLHDLVVDPPPTTGVAHIVDALARGEISSGLSTEPLMDKAMRVALWALMHYPGQYIPRHHLWRWATGESHAHKANRQARELRLRGLREAIHALNIPCVGLISQRETTDPSTVSGYRLTYTADDYVRHVAMPSMRQTRSAIRRYAVSVRGLGDGHPLAGSEQANVRALATLVAQ